MNLSDLGGPAGASASNSKPNVEPLDPQALIAQLGSEVATALSSALERVAALAATGRIDRDSLRSLREEIDLARRAGIMGQQVVRLGNGRVQLARERLDLSGLLRDALLQRSREIDARGIEVRQVFAAAEVMSDATLLFSLLQTLLDWTFEHAVSRIDIKLDLKSWPSHARITIGYLHQQPDEVAPAPKTEGPLREALEVARLSGMTEEELAVYEREKIAEQDARGMLTLAEREGEARGEMRGRDLGLKEGKDLGLKEALVAVRRARGVPLGAEAEQRIRSCDDPVLLSTWLARAATCSTVEQVLDS